MKAISKKTQVLLVFIGSIPGALLRSQINNYLLVNILGVFFLGVVFGLKLPPRAQILLSIGFCGSLTTFSRWMVDSFGLISRGSFFEASALIGSTLITGFLSLSLGFLLGKTIKQLFPPL